MSLLTWSLSKCRSRRTTYYYGGLIAAGYVIGALIRGFIRFSFVGRGRIRPRRRTGILYRMLRAVGEFDADMLESTEKVVRQIEYTVMNVTALVASIYFLIDHLQPALNWRRNVKP